MFLLLMLVTMVLLTVAMIYVGVHFDGLALE